MPFPAKYLDETEYCSLTVAAERSGYEYHYLTTLIRTGKIRRAPVDEVIMVEIKSLDNYMAQRYPHRLEALDIANTYGTVHAGHQNQYGPKCGCINKDAVAWLLQHGYIEFVTWQNGLKIYTITDKGRERAKTG